MKLLRKNIIIFLIIFIFLFTFKITNASGIVPCGSGNDQANACTLCHLIVGIHQIVTWGRNILVSISALGIFISGIMYIVSSGSEEMISKSKNFFKASLVGFTVTLMAWFFVNTVMWILSVKEDLTTGISSANWYTFTCSTNAKSRIPNLNISKKGVEKTPLIKIQVPDIEKADKINLSKK